MRSTALRLTAAVTLLTFGILPSANAQTQPINVVTTAVPFLRISPDARAGGMGDLAIATSPDASSSYFNLGKVPFNTSKAGINVTYTPWLKKLVNDVYLASLSGYYKLDDNQAISASLRYFSLGSIQFTDNFGNNLQSANPREFGVDLGYSRKLSDRLGLGIGLKYIYSNLAGGFAGNGTSYKAGNAVAGDIGLYYSGLNEQGQGWAFGAALTNLGSRIAYTDNADQRDYIPANLGIGTTYTKVFDESNKISFGIDLNKLLVPTPPTSTGNASADSAALADYRSKGVVSSWFNSFGDAPGGFSEEMKEFQASIGAEYWYNNQFALRAGYFFEDKTKGNRRYFTTGVGIKYNIFGLNFSYLIPSGSGNTQNPLSNTLRFSLVFDFDGGAGQ
ncbi:MAG TPA: type IX secretion system outer membrane channel protein PorV [Flavisolibacter sp.]|nr:type IX secretion system outer membrane channel protein PorV [Flavisolibacter sp.]